VKALLAGYSAHAFRDPQRLVQVCVCVCAAAVTGGAARRCAAATDGSAAIFSHLMRSPLTWRRCVRRWRSPRRALRSLQINSSCSCEDALRVLHEECIRGAPVWMEVERAISGALVGAAGGVASSALRSARCACVCVVLSRRFAPIHVVAVEGGRGHFGRGRQPSESRTRQTLAVVAVWGYARARVTLASVERTALITSLLLPCRPAARALLVGVARHFTRVPSAHAVQCPCCGSVCVQALDHVACASR
jgi:hypothetical protein